MAVKPTSREVVISPPITVKIDLDDPRFCSYDCMFECGGGAGSFGSETYSYALCGLRSRRSPEHCFRFKVNEYKPLRTLFCFANHVGEMPKPKVRRKKK